MNLNLSPKQTIAGLICLIALGGLALYGKTDVPKNSEDQTSWNTYGDSLLDFTFQYPDTYNALNDGSLLSYPDGHWQVSLAEKTASQNYVIVDFQNQSEHPPLITLRLFNKPATSIALSAWLKTHDLWGGASATIVAEAPDTLTASVSGLYEKDVYVLYFENYVVVAEAEWMEKHDRARKDLAEILKTFRSVSTTSQTVQTIEYKNNFLGFTLHYPSFYSYESVRSMPKSVYLFEVGSQEDVAHADDQMLVTVLKGSLGGAMFLADDGSTSGIFVYDEKNAAWIYKGFSGGIDGPVIELRPEEGQYFIDEGRIPKKYTTKAGYLAWVGESTSAHSTQGGCIWQTAFVESPDKTYAIKIRLQQAYGLSCAGEKVIFPHQYKATPQTIYTILDTLFFIK